MSRTSTAPSSTSTRLRNGGSDCRCGLCDPQPELLIDQVSAQGPSLLKKGRTLLLVDHQNLCGGADVASTVASDLWATLREVCRIAPTDDVVIALSSFGAAHYMTALPLRQVRLVLGNGPHGAARALCEFNDVGHVASRYDNVVIASGDHTLAELARQLRAREVFVANVTSSLSFASRELAAACNLRIRLKVVGPEEDATWVPAA